MSPLKKYLPHYTIADYRRWEGEWELWAGIAVSMSPSPFGPHQKMLAEFSYRIISAMREQDCDQCEVLVECDWIISDDTVLRPDLAIVCGTTTERHIEQTPTLIIEILSDSTREKDQTAKRDRYAAEGVMHYILCETDDQTITRLQRTPAGVYEDQTGANTSVTLHPGCHLPADTFRV